MDLLRQQSIFMQHVAELIRKAPEYKLQVTGGELLRTPEQQALYIQDGRNNTMNSQHLKGLAIDLNFFEEQTDGSLKLVTSNEAVRQLGMFWESLDPANRWGGQWNTFKDLPHFERGVGSAAAPAPAVPAPGLPLAAAAVPPAPVSTRGAKLLASAVGFGCLNQHDDVASVQRLLNLNNLRCALPAPLVSDGVFGAKTLDAIRTFQTRILNIATPDGTVKPGDAALLALCSVIAAGYNAVVLSLAYLDAADSAVATFTPQLDATMRQYAINTPLRQAHFLAQVGHESGELRFREEIASGAAYEGRRDLGNINPGDGPRYKGRGLIQLTGRSNYAAYGSSCGQDLINNPGLVASDDVLCADVAGWYWERNQLNSLADRDDLEGVTRRINGGLNGLDSRRRLLTRAKTLLDVG